MKATRRVFLSQTASAAAGLTLGFRIADPLNATTAVSFEPNAWVHIAPGNRVTLSITRSEMGQGVRTLLATLLSEELEVDPEQVTLEQAVPGARFKGIRLRTSGSGSSSGTYRALRTAGASARQMLIAAASDRWKVDASACKAEHGSVSHAGSGRRLTYGVLAEAAAQLPVPSNPRLKPLNEFRLIGKPRKRIDAPAIVRSAARYGADIRIPGMKFAVITRCPCPGSRLLSFDASRALRIPGVRHVIPINSGLFDGGVAIVADNTWSAFKAREAVNVNWDPGPNANFDSDRFIESLRATSYEGSYPIRREGDWTTRMKNAPPTLEATYEYPFQAHAPLESMNCTAHVRSDSCDIWVPTQAPETAQQNVMQALGFSSDAVRIHTTLLGGGFGRRLAVDYVDEAVEISKAISGPVQVIWSRQDDMQNGFFHPASAEQMSAWLTKDGIAAWSHKSAGSDLSTLGTLTAEEKANPNHYADDESPWGAFDTFYNFEAMKVDYVPVPSPVPTGPWRAVMYPARVFARESFLDEAEHTLSKDPIDLRIELLRPGDVVRLGSQDIDRGRMIRVLEEIRDKSGWNRPLSIPGQPGRLVGRGVAVNVYDAGSYVAQIAEVSVAADLKEFRVHRIVCVVDCGLPLNPSGLEGQVKSGIAWGLSAALHGKINFKLGRVVETGYHDFNVTRMNQMPLIETHILPGNAVLGGFSEHPVPPVAPAIANALFAATGKRVRKLPITPAQLHSA